MSEPPNGHHGRYPSAWDTTDDDGGFPEDPTMLLPGEKLRGRVDDDERYVREIAESLKDIPANGADDGARLDMAARQAVNRWWNPSSGYTGYEIARGIELGFASRMRNPPPEHEIDAAVERAMVGRGHPAEKGLSGTGKTPTAKRFAFIDSNELVDGDYRLDWLVEKVLAKGQPGTIAGPSKALKTNMAIDLAVSVASGTPFLGQFPVAGEKTVAVVSGESGAQTLQETLVRVCKAKHVSPKLGDMLRWCFSVPDLSDLIAVDEMVTELKLYGTDLVILDPLYLMLGAIDAKNMFEMGARLRTIAEMFVGVGITPLVIHHANKQLKVGSPMELADLAYSGLEQFARQWLLINRRTPYRDDGNHELWFRAGGSVGFGGLWAVRVEEGLTDEHFAGRKWEVAVQSVGAVNASTIEVKAAEKAKATQEKFEAAKIAVLHAIDVELERYEGATERTIRTRSGIATPMLPMVLEDLRENGVIEKHTFQKLSGNNAKQTYEGYRRFTPKPDLPAPDLLSVVSEESTVTVDSASQKKKPRKKRARK